MSLFNSILEKLGIRKPAASAPTAATTAAPVKPVAPASNAANASNIAAAHLFREEGEPPTPMHPVAIPVVDVVSKLTDLAASHPELDWKVSIVDLLNLLGIDSSYDARKNLATELGCPANLMNDSASMNTWLHKTVLQKIAENGGNIPESLLH